MRVFVCVCVCDVCACVCVCLCACAFACDIPTGRATGVQLKGMGVVMARKEVIVACGSINTPQLLMLSGIGPVNHSIVSLK